MIVVLAGGVGAARFLQGLVQVVPQNHITVIGNTGDDREFYGLHVSPDLDIVTYTLAGVVDETHGWGIHHDTYNTMSQLTRYGNEDWFMRGDRDQARPAPGVLDALKDAEAILLAPSNPIVSIGSILAIPGIHDVLHEVSGMVVAVSPIIAGAPIKGPADKLMSGLGMEVSAVGVARCYRDFLDVMVIDEQDT